MVTKKELEDKIKELESKLNSLDRTLREEDPYRIGRLERNDNDEEILSNFNESDILREVISAKKSSEQQAGVVKSTNDGSVWEEDDVATIKIPLTSIHDFSNLETCECGCHLRGKLDCIDCYDHPTHLESKRNMHKKIEYDEAKIKELIEADKAKKAKKSWWRR